GSGRGGRGGRARGLRRPLLRAEPHWRAGL
ncbi:MAG: hypothetical protein AVDCRST_MAG04-1993, partial [uncultured Acetobacteraceae bacterium]